MTIPTLDARGFRSALTPYPRASLTQSCWDTVSAIYRERGGERIERRQGAGLGLLLQHQDLVARCGEDNAEHLLEFFSEWETEDFPIVHPGEPIVATYDGRVIDIASA
jgi:hypothetical protein